MKTEQFESQKKQFTVGLKNPSGLSLDYILKSYKNYELLKKYLLTIGFPCNLYKPLMCSIITWDYKGKKYFVTMKRI
jgi:hypothetical protein